MNLPKILAALCLLAGTIWFSSDTAAQGFKWPEKAENLRVLPKNTEARRLRATMFGFANALGVRCTHCHVGESNKPLSTFDFASDAKPAKKTARLMMRMAQNINQQFIAQIDRPAAQKLQVNCLTCHKHQARPKRLEQILTEVNSGSGVDAAIEKYHQLRKRFYGGYTYDFRENPLNAVGYQLMGEGDLEGAIKIFKLNTEMNPDNSNVYDSLGEAYMKAGKTELALTNYKKSLELDPSNKNATKMIEQLSRK